MLLASTALLAACTASSSTPAASRSATRPPTVPQSAALAAVSCGLTIGNEPGPPAGQIVLGVVSLGTGTILGPTVRVDQGRWRYWQKYGLAIRAGNQAVTISVPEAWRTRAAITWGVNVGIVSTLRLPGCPGGPGRWNTYAGGFYLRSSSACVPLVVETGGRSTEVHVGVGRRC